MPARSPLHTPAEGPAAPDPAQTASPRAQVRRSTRAAASNTSQNFSSGSNRSKGLVGAGVTDTSSSSSGTPKHSPNFQPDAAKNYSSGSSVSSTASSSPHTSFAPPTALSNQYLPLLDRMVKEFDALESDLRVPPSADTNSPHQVQKSIARHSKLVIFLKHLRQAQERLLRGEEGKELEDLILTKFIPVHQRLVKQKEDATVDTNPSRIRTLPPTSFGKPLKGGSKLTQMLHGSSLGSKDRTEGAGVGSKDTRMRGKGEDRRVLRAGYTIGSENLKMPPPSIGGSQRPTEVKQDKMRSSDDITVKVMVGGSMVGLMKAKRGSRVDSSIVSPRPAPRPHNSCAPPPPPDESLHIPFVSGHPNAHPSNLRPMLASPGAVSNSPSPPSPSQHKNLDPADPVNFHPTPSSDPKTLKPSASVQEINNWVEADILRGGSGVKYVVGNSTVTINPTHPQDGRMGAQRKKKKMKKSKYEGPTEQTPKPVAYTCSLCSCTYPSTTTSNPWWSLVRNSCGSCGMSQIPRVDINSAPNAIQYHPALVAHESDGEESHAHLLPVNMVRDGGMALLREESSDSSESEDEGDRNGTEKQQGGLCLPVADMDTETAKRLLVLMEHARNCPGRHKRPEQREICQSMKFLLLHVRDCDGPRSPEGCPYPWCDRVRGLVRHVLECPEPENCKICSGAGLPENLKALRVHNMGRREEALRRERRKEEEKEKEKEKEGQKEEEATRNFDDNVPAFMPQSLRGVQSLKAERNSSNSLTVTPPEGSPKGSDGDEMESPGAKDERKQPVKVQETRRSSRIKG